MSDSTLPRQRRRLTGCVEPCRECGKPIGASHYGNGIGDRIRKYRVCFNCDVWLTVLGDTWMQALAKVEGPDAEAAWVREHGLSLIIGGAHYTAYLVSATGGVRGFGGREGRYVLLGDRAGTVHSSRNMWYQGEIPEHFRDRMPDTADWVSGHDLTPVKMGG